MLPWLIIGFGIILRIRQYVHNRSLWLDEASLALNIVDRSFVGLLQPLDYNQGAPLGFLLLEKLSVQILGNSEHALRLFPLACGILSLPVFYVVAKQIIDPGAVPVGLCLFAISDYLIYYSSEVKQYSCDVFVALLLFFFAFHFISEKWSARHVVSFGLLGAIAIWFSHPSIFLLSGIGVSLLYFSLTRGNRSKVFRLLVAYLFWAISFIACYLLCLRTLSANKALLGYWKSAFAPFPPSSIPDLVWYGDTFSGIFSMPTGFALEGIAALAFLLGCCSLFRERREKIFILISPAVFALVASVLQRYPFRGRLLLFLVPILMLLIAQGIWHVWRTTRAISPAVGIILVCLLVCSPAAVACSDFVKPRGREEIRPVLAYLNSHWRLGDKTYLYYGAKRAFTYYDEREHYQIRDYVLGTSSREHWFTYVKELDALCGNPRVWVLFSHVHRTSGVDERKLFLQYLDELGTRIESFEQPGAALYLYDLSTCPAVAPGSSED